MRKYVVEFARGMVEVDSFHDAVLVAKQNQPSTILRGTWVITRFPWPGEARGLKGKDEGKLWKSPYWTLDWTHGKCKYMKIHGLWSGRLAQLINLLLIR